MATLTETKIGEKQMSESYLDVLKCEFAAKDGSFLIQLHPDLTWDKEAFSKLVTAMETCCKQY